MSIILLLLACSEKEATKPPEPVKAKPEEVKAAAPPRANTCTGTWPSYWQDPKFESQTMWKGQTVTNTAASQGWEKGKPGWTKIGRAHV